MTSAELLSPQDIGLAPLTGFENQAFGGLEEELNQRFAPERISALCQSFLERGPFGNITEQLDGRRFVVALIDAADPQYADLGKLPETTVFAERFQRPKSEVYREYEQYDASSTYIVVIDAADPQEPTVAGGLRAIHDSEESGLKSIKDLIADDPANPWRAELGTTLFAEGESYDPSSAWARLCQQAGVELIPESSLDIATIAVMPDYASDGALDGVSMLLYHSCLRYALGRGARNLVSIQDLIPLGILQAFGKPFDTFAGLEPHPYGGPYDTIPAYAIVERGMHRIRDCGDSAVGEVFIDGSHLGADAVLLQELDPATYSNKTLGLPSVPTAAAA